MTRRALPVRPYSKARLTGYTEPKPDAPGARQWMNGYHTGGGGFGGGAGGVSTGVEASAVIASARAAAAIAGGDPAVSQAAAEAKAAARAKVGRLASLPSIRRPSTSPLSLPAPAFLSSPSLPSPPLSPSPHNAEKSFSRYQTPYGHGLTMT
jgi:hypothetical protein